MEINPGIFKAYDIRGIFEKDFNEETAYWLGRAYAELIKEELKKNNIQIAVGKDMRLSSDRLEKKLIEGLIDSGINAVKIGLCSTPTFYFAVSQYNYDGGVMISASHNPGEWNGFKLTRAKAVPISGDTGIEFLKEKVLAGKFPAVKTKGSVKEIKGALEDQIRHDLKFIDTSKIKTLKIAVDTANGMGAQYIEELFKFVPGEIVKINFELDGSFPSHEADPIKEENLIQLKNKIMEVKADLGIAIDGDGDRIFFVDNDGRTINQAIIRGVLSRIFLKEKPGSKICYDIRPGRITRDLIEANGGKPVITKVGHSLIKEQMLKEDAYFAGESSGHFFLNMEIGCFEAPTIMIGKLLEEFSRDEKSVAEQISIYKKYFHSGEINFEVEDKEKVFHNLKNKYSDGQINLLDGISAEYSDFWFNVRASNTENKVRLNLEAISNEIMDEKTKEVSKIIMQ
jgi:phosphomannomutase